MIDGILDGVLGYLVEYDAMNGLVVERLLFFE